MSEEVEVFRGSLATRATFTENSLSLDPDTSFDEWTEIIGTLRIIHDASSFWLGDALNFGDKAYGEKYAQAIEETGYNVQTLTNYASVAGRIPPSQRRKNLKYGHHAEVAYLDPEERNHWLDRAEEEHWRREDLRRELRAARDGRSSDCAHEYVCRVCGELM